MCLIMFWYISFVSLTFSQHRTAYLGALLHTWAREFFCGASLHTWPRDGFATTSWISVHQEDLDPAAQTGCVHSLHAKLADKDKQELICSTRTRCLLRKIIYGYLCTLVHHIAIQYTCPSSFASFDHRLCGRLFEQQDSKGLPLVWGSKGIQTNTLGQGWGATPSINK